MGGKWLLSAGIVLGVLGGWLPFAVPERNGATMYGGLYLMRGFMADAGTMSKPNLLLLALFIVMTLAYFAAFWLALRLTDESGSVTGIAGFLGGAIAAQISAMMIAIVVTAVGAQSDVFGGAETFIPGAGIAAFVIAMPMIAAGLLGCWRDMRQMEIEQSRMYLMERIQALEKATGQVKAL